MNLQQTTKMRWVLFWIFISLFVTIVLATLAMVFLEFGKPTPEERDLLFKVFIGEIGVSVIAFFYSLFGLKNKFNTEELLTDYNQIEIIRNDLKQFVYDSSSKNNELSEDIINTKIQVDAVSNLLSKLIKSQEYVERLIVLPNYEIPNHNDLRSLDDIAGDIASKRVLLKLDIDVPGADNSGKPIDHYKFRRAKKTISFLLEKKSKIIILAGQGLSSIDYLDKNTPKDELEWHIENLSSQFENKINFIKANDLQFLEDYLAVLKDNEIIILPNLISISPEEVMNQKSNGTKRDTSYIHNDYLVQTLERHYDFFVLDDFRSSVMALPSNVGLAENKISAVGKGLEEDLSALETMIRTSIDLGRRSSDSRICICGSSRPSDIIIIAALLRSKIFDKFLIGPYPSLVFHLASGISLNHIAHEDLSYLAKTNKHNLHDLIDSDASSLINEYKDNFVLPQDYIVRESNEDKIISIENLEQHQGTICGIGPKTINNFKEVISRASMVFHFGMLGKSEKPYLFCTEEIIKSYANAECISFLAGDHILGIAGAIGVEGKINHLITGAKTTSYYITGKHLPGLEPFIK